MILILVLILILYMSMVYVMLQLNMLSDSIDEKFIKSKSDTVEFLNYTIKKYERALEELKAGTARLLSFAARKHDADYEKLSSRITNLSLKARPKKSPVKEIST